MRSKRILSGLTTRVALIVLIGAFTPNESWSRQGQNIPVSAFSGAQTAPKILAANSPESTVAFWLDARSGKNAIYSQTLADDGFPQFESGRLAIESAAPIENFDVVEGENDDVFVVWQETNGTASIFVQLLQKDGVAKWDAPLTIGKAERAQTSARITPDDAGGVYVVWEDRSALGRTDDSFIYVQRINEDGALLWDESGIEAANGNASIGDALSLSEALVVVWENQDDGKVYLRAFDQKDGEPVTDAGFKPSGSLFTMTRPRLEYQDFDDSINKALVYVIWQENRLLGNVDIYGQLISLEGEKEWRNNGIAIASGTGAQVNHSIVSDGDDGLLVAWEDQREGKIFSQRIRDNGTLRWKDSGVVVSESDGLQTEPHLISNADKGAYCVWQDDRNGNPDLFAQEISKSGKLDWGDEGIAIAAQAGEQSSASAFRLEDERIAFIWQDMRNGNADIYAQLATPSGDFVNAAPRIVSTPIASGVVGQAYSYAPTVLDVDLDTPFEFSLNNKIDWLSIDKNTGVLSGTPPSAATHKISIQVVDARDGEGAQEFELEITEGENTPPRITSSPITTIDEDAAYAYQIVVEDPDNNETHTFAGESLPEWLKVDSATGLLSGTPLNAHVGRHELTVVATDRAGAEGRQAFAIDVTNTNDPPQISSANFPTATLEDQAFTYTVEASDPDLGDRLTFALTQNPAWLTINPENGQLSGTPSNEHVGGNAISVRVQDVTGATADAAFTLQVQNVNDPPIFTSAPGLEAFVGVEYNYSVTAQDVDLGDQLTVTVEKKPAWLQWSAGNWRLSGIPTSSAAGRVDSVRLKLRDAAAASISQAFTITVKGSNEPDTVAPDPPTDAKFSPETWTNAASVTLRWTTPSDQSGIAFAYLKLGEAPGNVNDFDLEHTVKAAAGEVDSVSFAAVQEGESPVYLWFKDRSNNVDVSKAIEIRYRVDRTTPSLPAVVRPNAFSRSDTVKFVWTGANDAGSGIEKYELTVDGHFQGLVQPVALGGDTLFTELPLFLNGKLFRWRVTAFDSAGNQSVSADATFDLDDAKPIIIHPLMESASTTSDVTVEAEVFDRFSDIDLVEIHFRTAGKQAVTVRSMSRQSSGDNIYRAVIGKNETEAEGLEYNIVAVDGAGNRQSLQTDLFISSFVSLPIASNSAEAPNGTFENRYQMISVPYNTPGMTVQQVFEDNFGRYKNFEWRLLRYSLDGAYTELDVDDFGALQPGQAFWLITKKSRTFRAKDVVSVRTDEAFEMTAAPGWNMIGSPFAFDVDLAAQAFSDGSPVVAWTFNGDGYVLETEKLAAWQGYFVDNTSLQSQTLRLVPSPAETVLAKERDIWRDKEAVLQISAELNGFTDESNFVGLNGEDDGVQMLSQISEPPIIGRSPRLFFSENDSDEEFATMFKNADADLSWELVAENLSVGKMSIKLNLVKGFSEPLQALIVDRQSGVERRLPLDGEASFFIGEGETERRFLLSLLAKGDNAQQSATPENFELQQPWPNPYRFSSGREIAIRFTLEKPSNVQIGVIDLLGREVWRGGNFADMPKGEHAIAWNGRDSLGEPAASGVYFVVLTVDGFLKARRKILILQ